MDEKLSAPQNISAEARDCAVRVSWDAVKGACGYILYFFKKGAPRECIKKRYAQTNSKVILGFFNGQSYNVYVCAFYYDKSGAECVGEPSKKAAFTPISPDLKAQKVVCLKTGEQAQLVWEWRNTRPNVDFYSQDRSIAEVDYEGMIRAVGSGSTEIVITTEDQRFVTTVYVDRDDPVTRKNAVMMFTGDIMCAVNHQRACADRYFDFNDSFTEVRDILSGADFSAGVLETTCYDGAPYEYEKLRLESGAPNCNSPSSFLSAVSEAGFDMLVTANNHCADTGYVGLSDTVDKVKKYGMANLGTMGDNPVIREINGIKVGFIACSMISNGQEQNYPELNAKNIGAYSREYFRDMYDTAKDNGAEFIVAIVHWGGMNTKTIRENQFQEAQNMVLCGADLIVGSHPHVIQAFHNVETLGGDYVPCAFSLGNFVTSQAEMKENRDSVILRVELYRESGKVKSDVSYIPCMNVNSPSGVKVLPIANCFSDASRQALTRIKNTLGNQIAPYEYKPSVMLSGSVILERIFNCGSMLRVDKTPVLLSQLSACGGEIDRYSPTRNCYDNAFALDTNKNFTEYLKKSKSEYIAVDFYTSAAVSCYQLDGKIYTGTNKFLRSDFYKSRKNEFVRIKPPFKESFWKPLVKKYADAVRAVFPSERIILFRQTFSDRFIKGGSELRNISPRASLNKQLAEMEEYFISLVNPSIVQLSQYYYNVGSSPSNYEDAYFRDAYRAAGMIINDKRRYIDTPDPDIWFERVMSCYDNMTARAYRSWFLDMTHAADILIAYTTKDFAFENRERLLKLKACSGATLGKVSSFFADDPYAGNLVRAAEIIHAILNNNISKPYDFFSLAFQRGFNILKAMAKLLSEETGAYVSIESAEKVFLLRGRPDELQEYVASLKERTADIWGSCITREIFNTCKNTGVGKYIFKQSPVLAYDNPVPVEVSEDNAMFCGNAWRAKTVRDSFARTGIADLRAEHSKWLVVDFYDVVCNMNEYKGELFEVDDFICRTDFYKSIKKDCRKCSPVEKRTEEECRRAVMRFSGEMAEIYGSNIILIKADLKDTFVNLDNRPEKMAEDKLLEKKRALIAMCEDIFAQITKCAVIDISKEFYASDKFPLGGAHIVHYEQEFYREAGVYVAFILAAKGKQRKFLKANENYQIIRNLRINR